jgi:ATP-dependent Clp protease adaptor protein ClpS
MATDTESRIAEEQAARLRRPWIVILYNDDWHGFGEVIAQVQKATGCSLTRAEQITMEAHTNGRAIAYTGPAEACERVAAILRQIRLQVETDAA